MFRLMKFASSMLVAFGVGWDPVVSDALVSGVGSAGRICLLPRLWKTALEKCLSDSGGWSTRGGGEGSKVKATK